MYFCTNVLELHVLCVLDKRAFCANIKKLFSLNFGSFFLGKERALPGSPQLERPAPDRAARNTKRDAKQHLTQVEGERILLGQRR